MTFFAKEQRKVAKSRGKELSTTYLFWYRRRYNLPINDPRVLDLTPADIEEDYWAHYYYENEQKEEFEDSDFDIEELINSEDDWETVIEEK